MRARSRTVTRTRARSLSAATAYAFLLPAPPAPTLDQLPTELLLHILRLAAARPILPRGRRLLEISDSEYSDAESKGDYSEDDAPPPHLDARTLRNLARVSSTIAVVAHALLYKTVAPRTSAGLERFARTAAPPPPIAFTLAGASSPISPISMSFPPRALTPKYTSRLLLAPPAAPSGPPRGPGAAVAQRARERFIGAARDLLFPPSCAGVPSPLLAHLRTLLADADLLEALRYPAAGSKFDGASGPAPTELVLSTYIRAPAAFVALASSGSAQNETRSPALAPLAARVTHLAVAAPSSSAWRAPRGTLEALGLLPTFASEDKPGSSTLTHLAFVRRAHANAENDMEFAHDVRSAIAALPGMRVVVLAVLVDAGYETWQRERRARARATSSAMEVDSPSNGSEREGRLRDMDGVSLWAGIDTETRALETYLALSHIWSILSALAADFPLPSTRSPASTFAASHDSSSVSVCIIPARGPAWARAMRAHVPPPCTPSIADAVPGVGIGNMYLSRSACTSSEYGEDTRADDLWSWARAYEAGRRRREVAREHMVEV